MSITLPEVAPLAYYAAIGLDGVHTRVCRSTYVL